MGRLAAPCSRAKTFWVFYYVPAETTFGDVALATAHKRQGGHIVGDERLAGEFADAV